MALTGQRWLLLVVSLLPAGSSPLSQISLLQKGDFSPPLSACYREVPFPRRGSPVSPWAVDFLWKPPTAQSISGDTGQGRRGKQGRDGSGHPHARLPGPWASPSEHVILRPASACAKGQPAGPRHHRTRIRCSQDKGTEQSAEL